MTKTETPSAGEIKAKALEFGADLVGIGDAGRFDGTPDSKDPRSIAPAMKSIVGLGFRVLRGSLRGIESGTNFYQFPAMGIRNIDTRIIPHVLRKLACFLEDRGFEGAALMPEYDRRPCGDPGINPEMAATSKISGRPVAAGKAAPDVIPDHAQAAFLCGLGKQGLGGFFLTPEFGPLQRFAFLLTDAELEPDPIFTGGICDECGKCVRACPGKAISDSEIEECFWGGHRIQRRTLDEWRCAAYYSGACPETNPFLPPAAAENQREVPEEQRLNPEEIRAMRRKLFSYYGGVGDNYAACICGKACQVECFIHLQERGILKRKFKNPFRTEPPWRIAEKTSRP